MDVRIISWKASGLRVPDWEFNIDPTNGKKTANNARKVLKYFKLLLD